MNENPVGSTGPASVENALSFFRECILEPCQAKAKHYRQSGFGEGAYPAEWDWVVLAALLTGDRPAGGHSISQLIRHHVRSHVFGSGPSYTIVQEYVEVEFEAFQARPHLVWSFSPDLSRVEMRRFTGEEWIECVQELGGIEFFAFSRFTDPEVTIDSSWMFERSELMLVLDGGRLSYLSPVLMEQ